MYNRPRDAMLCFLSQLMTCTHDYGSRWKNALFVSHGPNFLCFALNSISPPSGGFPTNTKMLILQQTHILILECKRMCHIRWSRGKQVRVYWHKKWWKALSNPGLNLNSTFQQRHSKQHSLEVQESSERLYVYRSIPLRRIMTTTEKKRHFPEAHILPTLPSQSAV